MSNLKNRNLPFLSNLDIESQNSELSNIYNNVEAMVKIPPKRTIMNPSRGVTWQTQEQTTLVEALINIQRLAEEFIGANFSKR